MENNRIRQLNESLNPESKILEEAFKTPGGWKEAKKDLENNIDEGFAVLNSILEDGDESYDESEYKKLFSSLDKAYSAMIKAMKLIP